MNPDILNEISNKDYGSIRKKIDEFLQEEIQKGHTHGLVFGLSGGIDSTTIAYLCSISLKNKSLALIMPDSNTTPKTELEDALKVITKLGIAYKLIDINPIHKEYGNYIDQNHLALGNLRARIRANLLYYYANSNNYLVVGSSDKSEYLIGYFTKFGDGSADIIPIVSLYKTQVRKLAKFLGVPESIILKKSSPNLWKDHFAESEIGASYEEIDAILYCFIDKKMSIQETVKLTGIDKMKVEKIINMNKDSVHKRNLANAAVL